MTNKMTDKIRMTMDLGKINSFLDIFQKNMQRGYVFLKDKKNNSTIMLMIAIATSALAIYFGIQLYSDIVVLNGRSSELTNVSTYDTRTLQADPITQNILKNSDTINDLLQENKSVQ